METQYDMLTNIMLSRSIDILDTLCPINFGPDHLGHAVYETFVTHLVWTKRVNW